MRTVERLKSAIRDLSGGIMGPVTFAAVPEPSQAASGASAGSAGEVEAGAASLPAAGSMSAAASFKPSPMRRSATGGAGSEGGDASPAGGNDGAAGSSARLVAPHLRPTASFRAVKAPHVAAGNTHCGSSRAEDGHAAAGAGIGDASAAMASNLLAVSSIQAAPALKGAAQERSASAGESAAFAATPAASSAPVARFAAANADSEAAAAQPATVAAAAPALNKIALENMKRGNPQSEWGILNDGDANIQGFATSISTNVGGTVEFKIATDSTKYRIDIYRMGYYGGDGARKVGSISQQLATAQIQPHPLVDMERGLIDCGNWAVSASWSIPSDAVSGLYFAKLVREDGTSGQSMIPFVVREDGNKSDIVFQTSDTTWQAYNEWGGASLYFGDVPTDPNDMIAYMPPNCGCGINAIGRAKAVSYNRPIVTNTSTKGGPHDYIFGAEYSAIRWLEQNGYDVSYISGVDTSRAGSSLLDHKAFLSVGHDEYWSPEQRQAIENARDAGVNLAFWGGNDGYWRIRWEDSTDASGTPYRTLVCYKETLSNSNIDQQADTGTWRDPRFGAPAAPENALIGTMFQVDSYRQDQITVPYDYSQLRFWRNTDISTLKPGETGTLVENLLGYEWNSDVDNGFRPSGLINLSLTNVSVNQYLLDYGSQVGPGNAQHSLTMYRASSGALVFSAGTVFWSWGLDANHEGAATPVDRNVQQSMINMFADMGIQPTTLVASLIAATGTTDFVKPTATVTSPGIGNTFAEGQRLVITGTASDGGGGRVAGVEISLDNGQTWRKAIGLSSWTYAWNAQAAGNYVIKVRATDDSLNIGDASSGTAITVTTPTTKSLWTYADKPAQDTTIERKGVELGVRFTASVDGSVTAIRFYKGQFNSGEHTVDLWTADGRLLASKLSVDETATGWQTVTLTQSIRLVAGQTYVASYHTKGYYAADDNYFTNTYAKGPLAVSSGGGVFRYSDTPGAFPNEAGYANVNYWVDVVFDPDATHVNRPPVASDDSGFSTPSNTAISLAAAQLLVNDNDPDGDSLLVTGVSAAVNGSVSFDSQNKSVTFTPTAGFTGTAGFSYSISDGKGGTASAKVSLQVGQPASQSLFTASNTPAIQNSGDNGSVELGMKFVAASNGTISAVRFYKGSANTGTHTGSLWDASGQRMGTVTFTNETASGWQTATFSAPIAITAGTTYTVSYHTASGYSYTPDGFANPIANGQLTAPSSTSSGGNGVFRYGSGGVVPNQSYENTNYWVDVVFTPSGTATNRTPVAANDTGFSTARNTALTLNASTLLANDSDADGDALTITGISGATNGTVSYDSQTKVVTFTPTAGYTGAAGFTYAISDGRGGASSASVALNVTDPNPANQTPVARNDSGYSTAKNTAFTLAASTLLANDTDADGDALSVTGVSGATNGTVSYDSQTKQVTFTPTAGYTGAAGFTYAISDGKGGTASASVALSVTDPVATQSLFSASATPAVQNSGDNQGVELGMKFSASVDGTITGVRFFKGSANTGSHTGTLWSASGQRLGTVSFTNETASGWQSATFSAPVAITAGTTYTVSYYTSSGYSYTSNGFSSAVTNGALTAPTGGNGVFRYGGGNVAPAESYGNTNYWVDVLFAPGGTAPNRNPVAANDSGFSVAKNNALTLNASTLLANDTDADGDALSITGVSGAVNGTVSFDSQSKQVTFTPTAGYTGTASFSYAVADGKGGTASASVALNVTDPAVTQTIFASTDAPATVRVNDASPVELGMKFKADVAGTVTAIRFFKGADNTGPHEGRLWNAANQLVGTVNFTNETASGWQEATLATPVNIAAGQTYTVSYHTNGYYSATSDGFATNKVSGNLEALSGAVAGGNGVFKYGPSGTFPNESYNKTNYYVDVVFKPQLAA
ncbi:MAG: DUF4082 domain-containing protein [Methylobacterium mesophilicum]|nr:DUF4082 domain-containing protein [Methylobacterium mesophilicum]